MNVAGKIARGNASGIRNTTGPTKGPENWPVRSGRGSNKTYDYGGVPRAAGGKGGLYTFGGMVEERTEKVIACWSFSSMEGAKKREIIMKSVNLI